MIQAAVDEVAFSRIVHHRFRESVQSAVRERPALVLVIPDPSQRHIDLIDNPPSLDAELLLGRFDPQVQSAEEIAEHFPERAIYIVDVRQQEMQRVRDREIVP